MRITPSVSPSLRSLLLAFMLGLSLLLPEQGPITQVAFAQGGSPATIGEWQPVNNWGIFGKHMVMMPNGKALAWPTGQDAFVWDPVTNTKTAVPASFGDLHCAAQTTLADGRVIVMGGVVVSPHDGIAVTAIFDPATNLWSQETPMHSPRWYPTSTTLPDGRVLISSGDMPGGGRANIPEIYDPVANTWTELPASATKDLGLYPFMFVLPDGRVYNAGTKTSTYVLDVNSASPTYGTWVNGPTNSFGSSGYAESAAMYAPGKIIRSGGGDPSIKSAAIIDMNAATPAWKLVSPMNFARRRHNMVILADGEVMAVGGTRDGDNLGDGITTGAVYEGEIWNPATGQWTTTARMTNDRMYHSSALLLPDGSVLTAGGENFGRLNSQIFKPPYLFKKAQRPAITAAPDVIGYGSPFNVSFTTDGASIASVALIRPSAVTHAFDHNQRYVPLTFTPNGNTLAASAPANGNIAPPGYYMLVVKDSDGVPSVAKWVRLDSTANLQPGTVTGKVTDGASSPINGATVSYSGGLTNTNGSGDYTLNNVLPGEHVFTASMGGLADVSKSQVVVGGSTTTLNFTLTPPGTITGTITNSETSNPIAGATITYNGGTATSDSTGVYTITNIPSGPQTLVASAPGFNSSPDQIVNVPANGTVTHNVALTPKPSFIAGEVRDSSTQLTIAGATVAAGAAVTTTDSLGRYQLFVPPATDPYTVTVSKSGYASTSKQVIVTFGSYTAADFTLDPVSPPITFSTVADDYTEAAIPSKNNGTAQTLRLDSGSVNEDAYLRFNVTGLTRPVQSAKLRLYVAANNGNGGSDRGGDVFTVSNYYTGTTTPWTEVGINWSNAPAITGIPLSSAGAVAENTWVEFDVTSAVTGNGAINFGLKAGSTDEVRYSSKEGTNPPQLVIQQDPPPSISGFTPTSGQVGTEVTISGANFAGITGVTFNSTAASNFTVDSATQIRAVVPSGATSGKIHVISSGGTATSADDFTVTLPPLPTISGFTPPSGPTGTEVMIQGTGFSNVTTVKFNNVPASSFTVESPTMIHGVVPNSATSGKISVTTAAGLATSATNFVVTIPAPPPAISGFTPASGPVGTEVTINGTRFVGVTGVSFHGAAASSFTVDSATQIHAVVPNGATSGKISVTTVTGSASSATNFTVTSKPQPQQQQRVYLPLIRTGAAANAATAQYTVLSWDESEPTAYLCLLGKR